MKMNNKWTVGCLLLAYFLCTVSSQYFEEEEEEEDVGEEAGVPNQTESNINGTGNSTGNGTYTPPYVVGQVNHILSNTEALNITGIVDQALAIRNNEPVRKLVNSIMEAVFCNQFLASYNNCGIRGDETGIKNPSSSVRQKSS